ncbi:hypothetical protein GGX14DRAFT_460740 [Mycena pura]|uniref:Acetyl-CoA synthetase-like protein n=1 Tax=Mycena pura TaxID=153505 RepID=A0AAD6YDW0_9AGAR|nr:hypothetical protein GGX14DRAFT_460740 [Mycena pura]
MARPSLPPVHARASAFKPPPLDGSLTMPQIYDWHLQNNPNHRLFVYARDDGSTRTICWREAVQAVHVGAKLLRDRFGWVPGRPKSHIVAILAPSDTISYWILYISCLRANYVAFPISPRNSPAAVAHLLNKVGVNYLLIGHDPAMQELANSTFEILKKQHPSAPVPYVSDVPLFEELFLTETETTSLPTSGVLPYEFKGADAVECILHSSGSTAFPKPINLSNLTIMHYAMTPWYGERDLTNQVLALHAMPMYHGMGIVQTFWTAVCGMVVSTFEPKKIPPIPTPGGLFRAAKATNSDFVFCVPSFVEAWSREPEYIKWLATRSGVIYSGGPLNKEAGDYITSQGVSIFIAYGATEFGFISPFLPAKVGRDWEYFTFPDSIAVEMVPYGDDTFEMIVVSNEHLASPVVNRKVRGRDAYASSDLLKPHPSKPGYWKIFGRADDQIMHSTGEKTNPGPLETMMNQDPHVRISVMFGRGRFQAGILVDPELAFKVDPSDEVKLAEFRNLIWPTVVQMNKIAPQHSRLFKEHPISRFTYTAKMTARRQAVIADYDDEIATLYDDVEKTTSTVLKVQSLTEWDNASVLDFVRDVVKNVVASGLHDDEDIFQRGCDSLQATWIRNTVLRVLRDSAQLDTRRDTQNFVYDHPTISSLAQFIFAVASGEAASVSSADTLREMVAKYAGDFPNHVGDRALPPANAKVALVTGTTGELGCYLLASLLADDNVARIYALNRVSSQQLNLFDRQASALRDRGLDASILNSPKLSLLEADVGKPMLNLSSPTYEMIQESVTHVIHNAWPVDFNLALPSFEPSIKGLRNLVDFSLGSPYGSPPTLLYTSSIGVLRNTKTKTPLKETHVDADTSANGYSKSKWVSEQILAKAAELTPLKAVTVRVGQLSGGINGAWNVKEWVPALVQSGTVLGCTPDDSRGVSWIPVHNAAAAMVDLLEAPSTSIVHLTHPRPVAWTALGCIVASELGVPLVPYADWLSQLETTAQTGAHEAARPFRAARLLPFFRALMREDGECEAFGFPKLDMTNALSLSASLRSLSCQLGETDVKQWLSYWRSAGLHSRTRAVPALARITVTAVPTIVETARTVATSRNRNSLNGSSAR